MTHVTTSMDGSACDERAFEMLRVLDLAGGAGASRLPMRP